MGENTRVRQVDEADPLLEQATKAGVGELFSQTRDKLSQYLRHSNYKWACAFGISLPDGPGEPVVFSLFPWKSSSPKGLFYTIYSNLLSKCRGVDEDIVLSHLPPDRNRCAAYQGAPEDLRGWAGYITSHEDIQKIVDLFKNTERQKSPES